MPWSWWVDMSCRKPDVDRVGRGRVVAGHEHPDREAEEGERQRRGPPPSPRSGPLGRRRAVVTAVVRRRSSGRVRGSAVVAGGAGDRRCRWRAPVSVAAARVVGHPTMLAGRAPAATLRAPGRRLSRGARRRQPPGSMARRWRGPGASRSPTRRRRRAPTATRARRRRSAMWVAEVVDGRAGTSASAAATSGRSAMRRRLTQVGGSRSISPAAWRSMAASGVVHTWSPISLPSTTTSAAPVGQPAQEEPRGVAAGCLAGRVPVGERHEVGGREHQAGLLVRPRGPPRRGRRRAPCRRRPRPGRRGTPTARRTPGPWSCAASGTRGRPAVSRTQHDRRRVVDGVSRSRLTAGQQVDHAARMPRLDRRVRRSRPDGTATAGSSVVAAASAVVS